MELLAIIVFFLAVLFLVSQSRSSTSARERERVGWGLGSTPYILPPPAESGDAEETEAAADHDEAEHDEPYNIVPSSTSTVTDPPSGARRKLRSFARRSAAAVVFFWVSFHFDKLLEQYMHNQARGGSYDPSKGFFTALIEAVFGIIWILLVGLVWLVLAVPRFIWGAIFPVERTGNIFLLGCFVGLVLVEVAASLPKLRLRPQPRHEEKPRSRTGSGVLSTLMKPFHDGALIVLEFIVSLFRPRRPRHQEQSFHHAEELPMDNETNPPEEPKGPPPIDEKIRDFAVQYGVPFKPREADDYTSFFQEALERFKTTQVEKTIVRQTGAVRRWKELLSEYAEYEEIRVRGLTAKLAATKLQKQFEDVSQIQTAELLLQKAEIEAKLAKALLEKAEYEAKIRDLQSSPKAADPSPLDQVKLDLEVAKTRAEIEKLLNPQAKPDITASIERKLEAIAKLETRRNDLLAQAGSDEQRERIRTLFNAEINRVKEFGTK